jgi:hypothetical protein
MCALWGINQASGTVAHRLSLQTLTRLIAARSDHTVQGCRRRSHFEGAKSEGANTGNRGFAVCEEVPMISHDPQWVSYKTSQVSEQDTFSHVLNYLKGKIKREQVV